jgi:hypothetical protein
MGVILASVGHTLFIYASHQVKDPGFLAPTAKSFYFDQDKGVEHEKEKICHPADK